MSDRSFPVSVCIETLYKDEPFLTRIERVSDMNFEAVEFWGWKNKDLEEINERVKELNLEIAAVVGSEAPLTDPERKKESVKDIERSLKIAQDIDSENLIITVGQEQEGLERSVQRGNIVEILEEVAQSAEESGVTLVLEPLNTKVDHQGNYLSSSFEGYEILESVNSPRVKLLFDIYHQQIMEGNLISNIRKNIDMIGHFHFADVPGRHEPGTGELNYGNIFKVIAGLEYNGYVGCEFIPSGLSQESLQVVKKLIP